MQEKLKEKESRKTQTFKKDDDKKKKLMQAEVQVGQAFVMCVKFILGSGVMASVINVMLYNAIKVFCRSSKCSSLVTF